MTRMYTVRLVLVALIFSASASASAQQPSPTMIRVRLPSQQAIAAAADRVRERFSEAEAVSPADKQALASSMSEAANSSTDLAERYALREIAALLLARAGYWREALQECDRYCAEFNIPSAGAHSLVLVAIIENLSAANQNGFDEPTLAALLIDALEGLLVEDNYQVANKLWPLLNARNGFGGMAQEYAMISSRMQQLYNSVALPALTRLKSNPLDTDAHQTLGDYYAIHKGDWEAALPHYALGTSAVIRPLALRELAHPQEHKEHAALAKDYQLAAAMTSRQESDWLRKRSQYWRSIAATSEKQFLSRFAGSPPSLPPQQEDVASFAPRVGHNMRRRGTPTGASLLLTFDRAGQGTGAPIEPVMIRHGRKTGGERVTHFDLSPRRNHVEGLSRGSTVVGLQHHSWQMPSAPLVCKERLLGQLPAFTWTSWVQLNSSAKCDPLFEELPQWPPTNDQPGLQFALGWEEGLQFRSPLAYTTPTTPGTTGFDCDVTAGSFLNRWVFVAVTVDYAQRVRVMLNHRTVTQTTGLLGPRAEQALTMIGATDGMLDNVTFYPRPLSEAEVTTIYHRALTRQSLAEYLVNGQQMPPPTADFPPIVYKPLNSVARNESSNSRNTSSNSSPEPSFSKPKPRTPKPSDDEIKEARALIRELYAADFSKATNTDRRRELAAKLKQVGRESRDSAASRYACMHEAADLLSDAEVPEAYDAWDELAKEFDVGVAREKGLLLDGMQKKAKLPTDHKYLADRYVRLLNEALEDDDYPLALSLATRAEACVKRAGDEVLEKTIDKGIKDIRQMMAAFEAAKPAKEKLATSPDDAEAAAKWGRYLCLYRGKWDDGLPLLAKGGDALATLAKSDRTNPATTKLQTEVAAEWWKAADGEKDERAQTQLRSRAVYWYQKVMPTVTGIQAAQIKQRVTDHQTAISPLPTKKPFDALSMVDVATHGLTGRWQKDRGMVGVIPERNSGSELVIPVALHGSYELSTRLEWQGRSGSVFLRLPVGDKMALLAIGSSSGLEDARGGSLNNVRSLHPATSLEAGRRYEVASAVIINDEDVEINVSLNSRPYLTWTGTLKDLDTGNANLRFGPQSRVPVSEPTIRFHGRNIDPFAIMTFQLNVTRGWAEPLMRVGPAIGSSRTGFN